MCVDPHETLDTNSNRVLTFEYLENSQALGELVT